jgi:hypothetical protein
MSYDMPKPKPLPARRLTHKDAKLAAKLYGLTYEEIRAREHAHNEAARVAPDEQKVQETDGT